MRITLFSGFALFLFLAVVNAHAQNTTITERARKQVEKSAGCKRCHSSLTFSNPEAKKYEVGNQIPNLPFKTKTSWAGNIAIKKSKKKGGYRRSIYFWLWGKEHNGMNADTVIWLAGGSGCSALQGMFEQVSAASSRIR